MLTKSWRHAASTQHCSPVLTTPKSQGKVDDSINNIMSSFLGATATTDPKNVKAATQTFDSVNTQFS